MSVVEIDSGAFTCELAAGAAPAHEIAPGSTVRIHCRHANDRNVGPGPVRADAANPGTGPIAVTGAEPGQALKFEILSVEPESPGHVSAGWKGGSQAVEIADGCAVFHGIRIPIAPMIGVLGVAARAYR